MVSFTDKRFLKFNKDSDKIYFFSEEYNIGTQIDHNRISKISWCCDSVKSVDINNISNDLLKKINIKYNDIENLLIIYLKNLDNFSYENYNTLKRFYKIYIQNM